MAASGIADFDIAAFDGVAQCFEGVARFLIGLPLPAHIGNLVVIDRVAAGFLGEFERCFQVAGAQAGDLNRKRQQVLRRDRRDTFMDDFAVGFANALLDFQQESLLFGQFIHRCGPPGVVIAG